MRKKGHLILFVSSVVLALFSAWLMLHVNVNSDMTKYLPSDSRMKQGLDILMNEFPASDFSTAIIKVMFTDLPPEQHKMVSESLLAIEDVTAVSFRSDSTGEHTLFELSVPNSIDQKSLGFEIRNAYGSAVIVETNQDGATPPFSVIVIAAVLIILVLLIMTASWLDPVLLLLTMGLAVLINMGTNALLPSVSITTNYIVAILQMVLSLDYAIILMNRYRQEMSPQRDIVQAVNAAIKRACPSILSSSLTTLVGLLMLCLMRLKIGMDLGIVLAKGVLFCLACTFTVLPSLIILLHGALEKTRKRTPIIPTDRLSAFVTRHKITFALFELVLFVGAFYFSQQTDIYFSTNAKSRIADHFPKTNAVVVLYNTEEDAQMLALADSLKRYPEVQQILSFPTLLQRPYTAPEMIASIQKMLMDFAEFIPDTVDLGMLTTDMMQMVYYMHSHESDSIRVDFPELIRFVAEDCVNDPLLSTYITPQMRTQIAALQDLMNNPLGEQTPQSPITNNESQMTSPSGTTGAAQSPVATGDRAGGVPSDTLPLRPADGALVDSLLADSMIYIIPFMSDLYALYPSSDTYYLMSIVDTVKLHSELTVDEMTDFVGSSFGQTKLIYKLSSGGRTRTPLRFVHILADDLFSRKMLSMMASREEKAALRRIAAIMDYADANACFTVPQMSELLVDYGLTTFTPQRVRQIAFPSAMDSALMADTDLLPESTDSLALGTAVGSNTAKPKKHIKTREEIQAETLIELMDTTRKFDYPAMARNFSRLGQNVDDATMHLLYTCYGKAMFYNDSLRMSPEELLNFVADTLAVDPTIAAFLDEKTKQSLPHMREQLNESLGMMHQENNAIFVIMTSLPDESQVTYDFVEQLDSWASSLLQQPYYLIGESVMFTEMRDGFDEEMKRLTLWTILAIFLIVVVSFRSIVVPSILVMTVMAAVYVDVVFAGIVSGRMLYLAYLISQSILMGATIDYGILYANYYKEFRRTLTKREAAKAAYHGTIPTVMTSGTIMVVAPGIMSVLVEDVTISAIVGCIAVGAAAAILLILFVLPAVLVALDRFVTLNKNKTSDN
ncbi:MAG: MMPL family transporter [Bacteroidales bacterium]|nr:MMPL family transporter [Candidatus Colicola coprequi]